MTRSKKQEEDVGKNLAGYSHNILLLLLAVVSLGYDFEEIQLACYFSSTFIPKDAQNAVSNKGVGVKLAIAAMQWGLSCDDEVLNSTLESVSFIRSREMSSVMSSSIIHPRFIIHHSSTTINHLFFNNRPTTNNSSS
eukprot:scaffold108_cov157-Chaetoceros_neogracile.AAC.4